MDIKLEDLQVQETMSIGDLGMGVKSVGGGGSIQFEEDPVDSGYVKYNAETGLYSTEEVDLSELDNKLDKTTDSGYRVYTSVNGEQMTRAYGDSPVANTIVSRSTTGTFGSQAPVKETDVTNKKYVDDIAKTIPQIELTQKENGAYKLTINKG